MTNKQNQALKPMPHTSSLICTSAYSKQDMTFASMMEKAYIRECNCHKSWP